MGNIVRSQNEKGTVVYLAETLDESVNLEKEIGPLKDSVQINCRNVMRINSVAVRQWMGYFRKLKDQNIRVQFQECAPAVIEQSLLFKGFLNGGEIVSVLVPYICSGCKKSSNELYDFSALKAGHFAPPSLPCKSCGKPAHFDDDPHGYFRNIKS